MLTTVSVTLTELRDIGPAVVSLNMLHETCIQSAVVGLSSSAMSRITSTSSSGAGETADWA